MICTTITSREDFGGRLVTSTSCDAGVPAETEIPGDNSATNTQKTAGGAGLETSVVESKNTVAGHPTVATEIIPSQILTTALPSTTANVDSTDAGAATATQQPTPVPLSQHRSDGVSKGAVAGIAIGTAIIGAAIAFGIAFLLFKRKKRGGVGVYGSTPEFTSYKPVPTPYVQEIPPPVAAAAVANRGSGHMSSPPDFLASVLPPGADDRTVAERVGALFLQIQRHVENFYRDVHASVTPSMEGDLSKFGTGGVNILDLLQTSSNPTAAIKHALVGYVLSITSSEGEEDSTLFPGDVVGVGRQEQFNNSGVHLHSSTTSTSLARQSDIREAAEHFAITFFPWANPAYDQEKDDDLVQIISTALNLSIWLYGQPFTTEYLWETRGGRGLVVAPQLLKVSDASGRVDGRPQVLLEPVVVSV
ncbi:hypothetical protein BDV96DRAFT_598538 [Lophiotrema nucula]|uniref:Uncharacterized protein n=1 Tax=Lophiotrema nucula TaxID=690887 RepID=A0A6A5ZBQ3_9PLEO|nr:hypothetical protein BDV96DRAFT_598538 [Lophiotrema nucula]